MNENMLLTPVTAHDERDSMVATVNKLKNLKRDFEEKKGLCRSPSDTETLFEKIAPVLLKRREQFS